MNYRYVAVEGPMGVGKTFLAEKLAEHWNMVPLLEHAEQNPFLPKFYQNRRCYGFATQIQFLMQRGMFAHELLSPEGFDTPRVADFMFDRDALLAELTLESDEWALYRQLRPLVLPEYPVPDLVIYLQASPSVLVERIERKNLMYVDDFPDGFLHDVVGRYHEYFHRYEAAPVMIVNTDHLDFEHRPADLKLLFEWLQEMRGQRSYFNPSF